MYTHDEVALQYARERQARLIAEADQARLARMAHADRRARTTR